MGRVLKGFLTSTKRMEKALLRPKAIAAPSSLVHKSAAGFAAAAQACMAEASAKHVQCVNAEKKVDEQVDEKKFEDEKVDEKRS